ncbi:hypothetical protein [Methylobacterium brachythecii]|uniref:Uncharacterized protein n=1 Tax=Methylobacterium brachythecii TaxID=1176177 RepID=A0A7W6F5H9_9HYPH|nr:hypothetical protein [Methylobacterium brachythecii]MBB3901353.1 hypothetical protein [Methylobacterium brachythecii]GLS42928.1 hypothetical protein GCM10007884_09130 [Methylobacterium brachythecii]
MSRALAVSIALVLAGSSVAMAQDSSLRDIARSQDRQAESLRRLETIERDRARREDSARHNAERDSRSMRRFD